ncbi:MAG: NAD(P)-dependent oxidoreductase [Candidatus Omnitrophica bacterium]|nr:NAD(P)-dependent oxidoreductase [Candidatus Omnitrophota bacterium]
MTATVVVTGASGFIGSWLSARLAERYPTAHIVGVGRHAGQAAQSRHQHVEFIPCDLLVSDLTRTLPGHADVVIHLAADRRPRVEMSGCSQQVMANVLMTSRLADYALKAKAQALLYASSSAVYSGVSHVPFTEEEVRLPAEHLGATKLAAEGLLKARALAGGLKAMTFRLFTTYGPGSAADQFVPEAMAKLLSPEPVASFLNPDVERDFIFVEDVVRAFLRGLEYLPRAGAYEVFNIGSGKATPVRVVIELLRRVLGSTKPVRYETASTTVVDARHQADIRRAAELLGWQPSVGLEEGLRRTVDTLQPVAP